MGSLRWDVVRTLLPPPGGSVLEIGCGQGAVGARLAADFDYLGVELDRESARTAVERLAALGRGEVRHGDLSVVEPDQTFDLVVALEVVEHIEDDTAAVAEWFARLRPGGELVVSTPAYQRRFGPMDELVGHHRRYEPPGLIGLLSAAGFVDVSVRHYGAPLAYVIEPVRNVIARRRLDHHSGAATLPPEVLAQRTGHSGRTLQPGSRAVGLAIELATVPVKLVQRRFPAWGPALIAYGRRPAG